MINGLLSLLVVIVFRALPSGLHHANKVLVGGDGHGQVGVVIHKLIEDDNTIVVAACTIKLVKEVGKDLVLSETVLKEVGVLGHIVDIADV